MRAKRVTLVVLATVGAISTLAGIAYVAGTGLLLLTFRTTCVDNVQSEWLSPSGKLKAIVYVRDCGATTGFSTKIAIVRPSATTPPYSDGIVFSADNASFDPARPVVKPDWVAENHLKLRYACDVELNQLTNFVENVHVQFEAVTSLHAPAEQQAADEP